LKDAQAARAELRVGEEEAKAVMRCMTNPRCGWVIKRKLFKPPSAAILRAYDAAHTYDDIFDGKASSDVDLVIIIIIIIIIISSCHIPRRTLLLAGLRWSWGVRPPDALGLSLVSGCSVLLTSFSCFCFFGIFLLI